MHWCQRFRGGHIFAVTVLQFPERVRRHKRSRAPGLMQSAVEIRRMEMQILQGRPVTVVIKADTQLAELRSIAL